MGVREGTIIAALIVGLIAKFFNKKLGFINNKLLMGKQFLVEEDITEEIKAA